MENPTLPQPLQPQQYHQPTSQAQSQPSKNVKNLSIKEFFTNRLMRARSFEGGGHSPKEEASPNWFDEFKARMTKKSQTSQSKQNAQTLGETAIADENGDDVNEPISSVGESNERGGGGMGGVGSGPGRMSRHFKIGKLYQAATDKDEYGGSLVRDACDNSTLDRVIESAEDISEESTLDHSETLTSASVAPKGFAKTKKPNRISTVDSPDFDTASINTIINRRDSRYNMLRGKQSRFGVSWLTGPLKFVMSYAMPLNYNLPWKLLSLINFTFVIIVLAIASEAAPRFMAFNFLNGFISGILVAACCFFILILSLVTQMMPSSSNSDTSSTSNQEDINSRAVDPTKTPNVSFIESKLRRQYVSFDSSRPKSDDSYSQVEVLGEDLIQDGTGRVDNPLDDDDYKSWMIEFVGDYEQRNKSEFKLKLIYVKIEDKVLQLCKPKNSHDAESATFPVFVHQRTYDLNSVKKFSVNLLLPRTVRNRQKYVWSKKYPIRLEFTDESDQSQTVKNLEAAPKLVQLTLFAKSCREKEEWFRRFKRVVEENRINQGQSIKRSSLKSETASGSDDVPIEGSNDNSRNVSPSPSVRVQTSRSSHLLGDLKRLLDDNDKQQQQQTTTTSKMTRTKSCELLNDEKSTSNESAYDASDHIDDEIGVKFMRTDPDDDSTLTRETANLFSQAIEYSNFIESQPTLDYKDYIERIILSSQEATSTSDWFNALIGRMFFDVFSHNYWSIWFKRKIQRKLYRIRLPYFMETLTLTHIDLGKNAPQFLNVVSHSFDSFGLSIDFDMAYSGGLTMTFETKLNLLKIKADNSSSTSSSNTTSASNQQASSTTTTSANANANPAQPPSSLIPEFPGKEPSSSGSLNQDNLASKDDTSAKVPLSSSSSTRTSGESSESDESDDDSSSDSSFDEAEIDEISDWEDYGAEKTRQNIVKFVDKIASSRYFQHATENRYIKKKLQDISNCPLVLIVQIQSLNGVLTVNVPPPQTNRIWYGFKPNPELTLKALPKMGDREVNLSHVTDWIERKLSEEFRKILVIPNMEDIVLPVLKSDHLLYVSSTK